MQCSWRLFVFAGLFSGGLFLGLCPAQTTQGLIAGRVVDSQTGSPVAGAQVSYQHPVTNARGQAETTAAGYYTLPLLSPGLYSIRVTADQYQSQEVHELELPVAGRVDLNSRLRPLSDIWEQGRYRGVFFPETEAVLTFYGPDVDTSRIGSFAANAGSRGTLEATVSRAIDPAELRALPFASRDVYTMLVTQAGVTADTTTARGLGLSINGQRPAASNFMLDGLENNNYLVTGPLSALAPEAVQEYRVSLSSFSSEYGRTSGYLANAVTRSGGNEWHGIGYFNLKNEVLNANDFQSNRRGLDRRPSKESQLGYHAGGPLRRNSLFFSTAFERLRTRNRQESIDIKVPAPGFAESFTSPGSLARRLLTEFPTPATSPGDGITSNLAVSPATSINRYLTLARIDYVSPAGGDRLMGRLALARLSRPDFIWSPYETFTSGLDQPTASLAFQYIKHLRPNLINELRLGWSQDDLLWNRAHPEIPTLVVARTLQSQGDAPEDVLRSTLLPGSGAFYEFQNASRNFEFNDNLIRVQGRHIIKLGGGVLFRNLDGFLTAGRDGRYIFDDIITFAFDQPRFFSASLTRGDLPRFQQPKFGREYRSKQFFLFLQDTFKLSSRLVLNLGLRYESFGAPSNTGGVKDAIVELGQGSSLAERLRSQSTGLSFTSAGDQRLYNRDSNDLALRLGLSYDLFGDSKTVVRGAYGIFYDRPFDNLWLNLRNNNVVLGTFPYRAAANPDGYFADVSRVLPAYEGSLFSKNFPPITLFDPNLRTGYAQNVFFGVQRDVTENWNAEVNVLGSLGRKLITTDIVNRQFSLPLDQTAGGRLNPALPDISYRAGQGSSSYYALTAVTRYRTGRALFQLAYTWGRTIDNQSDPLLGDFFDLSFTGATSGSSAGSRASFARQFDSSADRGNADFDQRHNLVMYSIWDLPGAFGSSKAAALFRDWKFAQIAAFRTGFPYTVFAASRAFGGGGQIINQRANITDPGQTVSASPMPVPGGMRLLNPVVGEGFAEPGASVLGGVGRNAFRGPGLYNVDLSLSRFFTPAWLGESGRLTIRADVFNVLNHANLNQPFDLVLGSETFGNALFGRRGRDTGFPALTPLDETARQVQLILRIEF
jgi:hypothetical protein